MEPRTVSKGLNAIAHVVPRHWARAPRSISGGGPENALPHIGATPATGGAGRQTNWLHLAAHAGPRFVEGNADPPCAL